MSHTTEPTSGGSAVPRRATIIEFPARRAPQPAEADPANPQLAALVEPYRRYLVGEGRRPEGVARYLWGLGRFLEWMPDGATVADVDGRRCQDYKESLANDKGAKAATIINSLAVIKDFSAFCIAKGYRGDDPTVGVKRPKKARPQPKPLHEHEIEELIEAIRMPPLLRERRRWHWERNRRLFYLLIYTGLRLHEAANTRWEDILLAADLIVVRSEIAKNGTERTVRLHARLKAILELVPEGERVGAVAGRKDGQCMSDRGMAKIFSNWLQEELKFSKVHAHRLRHSFACLMLWNGADIKTIQELLGHRNLSTTEWYLEAREDHKQAAIDRIPDFGA